MQTLRKKNSPCKLKNEPTRFLGEGVSFKAKLIGILEVSEARGDRMCQAALGDLKMAIRAAGEHKQRITVQISIDGLRLRDEKSGDCLYHHPVHKISFIAQDMSDSRAFGYIFGSPDTGHRFFGIKTDKAASQVVIAMRDLFQVVFELKKKEIELAKQHIEHNVIKFATYSVERSPDTKGAAGNETSFHRKSSDTDRSKKHEPQSGVVADLLDLQFELNSLQQGIHQMDKITPENPRPNEDPFQADPFGDSFANMKIKEQIKPILPPPPSTSKRHFERQQTVQQTPTPDTSSPTNIINNRTPPPQGSVHWFDKETEDLFNEGESSNSMRKNSSSDEDKETASILLQDQYKQVDIFSELDPLGTGSKKPYIDKKDFFQHLKNPPKKVLKDLASINSEDTFPTNFNITSEPSESNNTQTVENDSNKFDDIEFADFDKFKEKDISAAEKIKSPKIFKKESNKKAIQHQSLSVSLPSEECPASNPSQGYVISNSISSSKDSTENIQSLVKLQSPKKYIHSRKTELIAEYSGNKSQSIDRSFPIDFSATSDSPASPLRSCSSSANSRLSSSSTEMENVPEPPPRGIGSIIINPPPLPPKKHSSRAGIKPPPRPPHGEGHFHYDFLEREYGSPSPTRKLRGHGSPKSTKGKFDDNFSPPLPQLPKRSNTSSAFSNSSFEDSFHSMIQSPKSTIDNGISNKPGINWTNLTRDLTLSQLTSTFLIDLADNLGMSVAEVTSLTLQQLTECIESLARKESACENKITYSEAISNNLENKDSSSLIGTQKPNLETSIVANEPLFKTTFQQETNDRTSNNYDKYAVFRELLEMEKVNNDFTTQKSSEDEEPIASENQEEPGDIEDDAQSDEIDETIASLANLTIKLSSVSENQSKEVSTYYEIKSNMEGIDSPKENIITPQEETENDKYSFIEDNFKINNSFSEITNIHNDKPDSVDNDENIKESKESLDNFIITAEEVNELSKIIDKKSEIKPSPPLSTSSDKYAALREIIVESEKSSENNDNIVASPNKDSVRSSIEVDLQDLFSDSFSQQSTAIPTKITIKKEEETETTVLDIFEEIKMLNTDTHRLKDIKPVSSNLESMFSVFMETKLKKDNVKDDENWVKFESNIIQSDKSSGEGQESMGGTSPWSPEGKEFNREPPIKRSIHRHSGESDNEWKDDEESEESNGKTKGEGSCYGRYPRYDVPPFDDRTFYEETADGDKDRVFRDKICRKTTGLSWIKNAHRAREPLPWHDETRWEEERRRHIHRKVPYKDEEEYKAYWKCRPKQRHWNGEREGYWGPDHQFYEEEYKRRMTLWTDEERDNRERFSSQESMSYEDSERWFRRECERRRYEEEVYRGRGLEGEYPPRENYKKHDAHYFREGRDRHYDYPPSWEEEYGSKRPEESPRYLTRKKHWPKRPNSANDGREMMYVDIRPKCAVSRSECSDNDADIYHRPYRSRSRESYWGSDQEFESWGERSYCSEEPDTKSESFHRKRVNRHRTRFQPKSQSSPFEDDFTQNVQRSEAPIDSTSTEARIRPEIEIKKPPSPRSPRAAKDQARREQKTFKGSNYFDDDLTPTLSVSSETSDRQRISSELKVTPEESPCDVKDQGIDGSTSEGSGRDSFLNGDPRFDDDAYTFRSELEDQVPERATTLPINNSRHLKYTNSRSKGDHYIKKSESINIFSRENDPFDDDEFFN